MEVRRNPSRGIALPDCATFDKAKAYIFHELDLRPNLDELFRELHKNCVQRKIRRAEREDLMYEEGTRRHCCAKFYPFTA